MKKIMSLMLSGAIILSAPMSVLYVSATEETAKNAAHQAVVTAFDEVNTITESDNVTIQTTIVNQTVVTTTATVTTDKMPLVTKIDDKGRVMNENGQIIFINGTTAIMSVPQLTTVTTAEQHKNGTYNVEVKVIDADTYEPIKGLDVFLEKRPVVYSEDISEQGDHVKETDEKEVLEKWNTSDTDDYKSKDYTYTSEEQFNIVAAIYELPEDYSYYGNDIAELRANVPLNSTVDNTFTIVIPLRKNKYKASDFPIQGKYTHIFTVKDYSTGEYIKNLDCKIIDTKTNEVIYQWNTGDQAEFVTELNYSFENPRSPRNICNYGIVIENMPENYSFLESGDKGSAVHNLLVYPFSYYKSGETQVYSNITLKADGTELLLGDVTCITTEMTTTLPKTTTTTTTTTTTSNEKSDTCGDANCDDEVNLADAILIMQALANPDKYGIGGTAEYHLTEQGEVNADIDGDGMTVGDAQTIQMILLGLVEKKE